MRLSLQVLRLGYPCFFRLKTTGWHCESYVERKDHQRLRRKNATLRRMLDRGSWVTEHIKKYKKYKKGGRDNSLKGHDINKGGHGEKTHTVSWG
jgi:hypothetical protein